MTEYWKITKMKEYLLQLLKEDKLRCNVTRTEENDVTIKIKLMQEAEKFGRQESIKDEIEFLKKGIKMMKSEADYGSFFDLVEKRIKELEKN